MDRLLGSLLVGMLVLLGPGGALADVVMPPPASCPPGHTPQTGHEGPYCQPPPPASCPDGHTPKVYRDHAYCEPPADPPCPPGSYHQSRSAADTWCQAGWNAPEGGECSMGYKPIESGLCLTFVPWGRMGYHRASGTCESDADCTGKDESCEEAVRCVPVPLPAPPTPKPPPTEGEQATAAPVPATPGATAEPEPEDDEPGKARCAVGDPAAGPAAAPLGALAALAALLVARRR